MVTSAKPITSRACCCKRSCSVLYPFFAVFCLSVLSVKGSAKPSQSRCFLVSGSSCWFHVWCLGLQPSPVCAAEGRVQAGAFLTHNFWPERCNCASECMHRLSAMACSLLCKMPTAFVVQFVKDTAAVENVLPGHTCSNRSAVDFRQKCTDCTLLLVGCCMCGQPEFLKSLLKTLAKILESQLSKTNVMLCTISVVHRT